jgi:hypothetical protein
MSNKPQICPECSRAFAWGPDADSALVEAKGEQWLSCCENAHWKLTFHMQAKHPDAGFRCPRRSEGFMGRMEGNDWWGIRDGHKACSYCGSCSPDEFFAAIEAGAEVGPTDKSYKAYIDLPAVDEGARIEIGGESGPAYGQDGTPNRPDLTDEEKRTGRYHRTHYGMRGKTVHGKFYFQHLSKEEQVRFLDLLNARKIKIGVPGYFYALPFLATSAEKTSP